MILKREEAWSRVGGQLEVPGTCTHHIHTLKHFIIIETSKEKQSSVITLCAHQL